MGLVRRLEALLLRRWFGDAAMFAVCAGILVAALLMSPSTETLTLFGQPIPVMCTFRRLTGWSCPGCGLTRSFVFLAHGRLAEAWGMNPLGPVAFAYVAAQIPWRGVRLWRLTARPEAAGPYSADAAAHTPPSPPSGG